MTEVTEPNPSADSPLSARTDFDLLGDLRATLNQIVSTGPLIDSLDAGVWGPADPDGVRLVKAIHEASDAVDAWLTARSGIRAAHPESRPDPGEGLRVAAQEWANLCNDYDLNERGQAIMSRLRAALASPVPTDRPEPIDLLRRFVSHWEEFDNRLDGAVVETVTEARALLAAYRTEPGETKA